MKASEVQGFERLRQRHRNNPKGKWQPLSSLAERLPQRDVFVEVLGADGRGRWEQVELSRGARGPRSKGAGGVREGAGRKALKKKEVEGKIKKESKDG